MQVGSLKELRRYPVKSMGGELLSEVNLGTRGIVGDRAWAVRDEVRGGIRGGKKIPALMTLRARYLKPPADEGSSHAEITLPDGSTLDTSAPEVNEQLSKALDHEVTLWPLLPADQLDHYRRGARHRVLMRVMPSALCPIEYGGDTLLQSPRGFVFPRPDRLQHPEHLRRADSFNRSRAEFRVRVVFHRRQPRLRVFGIPPCRQQVRMNALGGFRKCQGFLSALSERVAPGAGNLAKPSRGLAGLGQRNEGGRA